MDAIINIKQLRHSLPELVRRVSKGARFIVLYRSRPAFKMIPIDDTASFASPLKDDPIYHASAVGRSKNGRAARDHDQILYGR